MVYFSQTVRGDPMPVDYAIQTIQTLIGKKPLFGICLGHQLLGLALGGKTFKLKFGHRGANQPVKYLETDRVEITSQNHGFCVDIDSLPNSVEVTHINLNDDTLEGIEHREYPIFSVQYHPEASPGPTRCKLSFLAFYKNDGLLTMRSGLPATLFRAGILVKLNRVGLTETFQNPRAVGLHRKPSRNIVLQVSYRGLHRER